MDWLAFVASWCALGAVVFTIWAQRRHEATIRAYQNAVDLLSSCPDCGGVRAGYIHNDPDCGVNRAYIEDGNTQK